MPGVHPTAIVAAGARLGAGIEIGPYSVVGAAVSVGEGTVIGDENVIREFVSINAGTAQDRGVTTIGSGNWLLAYSHIAHDCVVGNGTTFSNNAQLAGHVVVDDHVVLGGFVGVHQFCRIGAHAMVAAGSIVLQDVPPFVTAAGYPAKPRGTNSEGQRRRGFSAADIAAIKRAYRTLYRDGLALNEALEQISADAQQVPALERLAEFLKTAGRGIIR